MRHEITLNNYQMGGKLRTAPTHKIVETRRVDAKYTVVVFEGLTRSDICLMEKLFGTHKLTEMGA